MSLGVLASDRSSGDSTWESECPSVRLYHCCLYLACTAAKGRCHGANPHFLQKQIVSAKLLDPRAICAAIPTQALDPSVRTKPDLTLDHVSALRASGRAGTPARQSAKYSQISSAVRERPGPRPLEQASQPHHISVGKLLNSVSIPCMVSRLSKSCSGRLMARRMLSTASCSPACKSMLYSPLNALTPFSDSCVKGAPCPTSMCSATLFRTCKLPGTSCAAVVAQTPLCLILTGLQARRTHMRTWPQAHPKLTCLLSQIKRGHDQKTLGREKRQPPRQLRSIVANVHHAVAPMMVTACKCRPLVGRQCVADLDVDVRVDALEAAVPGPRSRLQRLRSKWCKSTRAALAGLKQTLVHACVRPNQCIHVHEAMRRALSSYI